MLSPTHYFFLGHAQSLAVLEIASLFGLTPTSLTPQIATLGDISLDAADRLGGVKKIALSIATTERSALFETLTGLIEQDPGKNIAITDYADLLLTKSDLYQLKGGIKRPIRFVSLETGEHESVMLRRQKVSEFNLLKVGTELVIAKTVWLQNGLDWAERDRSRPYQDIKRGMLPPKLARIMVNLAAGCEQGILLDPFCGTGTVLMEAALLGHTVLGSDNDEEAVQGARANLAWLEERYALSAPAEVITSDAVHLSQSVKVADYLVTEPYMGPLLDNRRELNMERVKDIAKGLDKLYRGCLRDWSKFLKSGGKIVMIIPSFLIGKKEISTISIDTITALGYNILRQVPYSKPNATVIRNITILEKQAN